MAPDAPGGAAPVLVVTDLPAARRFYADAFGFEPRRYFDGNDGYAVLELGRAQVHLFLGRRAVPHHAGGSHVADAFVWVDDLDPVLARAAAAGLTPERGPEHYDSSPVATTEVVLADPDGNWLCFATADTPPG